MASLPTVQIVNPKDPKDPVPWIINEQDYDPAKHTLWAERPKKTKAAEEKPAASSSTKKSSGKSD